MERDRDRTIENMLGYALKRQSAAAQTAACLDAETAAAWADGALSDVDRRRVEGHAASCARCQALVAALVRTSPAPVRSSWFRLPSVAWLAPLTAAAAALIVWAIVPAPADKSAAPAHATSANAPSAAAALDRPVAEAPPPVTPALTAPQSALKRVVPEAKQREKAFADRRQDVDALAKKENAKVVADAKSKDEFKLQASANEARAEQRQAPPAAAAASPPPVAAPSAAAPSEPKRDAGRGGAASAGAVAVAPPAASADAATMRKSLAESSAQNALRSRLDAPAPVVILSPNVDQRWRIVDAGSAGSVVERSTDSGRQWTAQPLAPTTRVTAGASPSPAVCWLVGPRGTVMLTTDGRTWQRLAFPEAVDLVAVRATDEANATVTAIDGRAFATTDRGVTWRSVVKPGVLRSFVLSPWSVPCPWSSLVQGSWSRRTGAD